MAEFQPKDFNNQDLAKVYEGVTDNAPIEGFATEATLLEVKNKLTDISDSQATASNQDIEIGVIEQVRDKLISSPATEGKQDTNISYLSDIKDYLQTTVDYLQSIDTKLNRQKNANISFVSFTGLLITDLKDAIETYRAAHTDLFQVEMVMSFEGGAVGYSAIVTYSTV